MYFIFTMLFLLCMLPESQQCKQLNTKIIKQVWIVLVFLLLSFLGFLWLLLLKILLLVPTKVILLSQNVLPASNSSALPSSVLSSYTPPSPAPPSLHLSPLHLPPLHLPPCTSFPQLLGETTPPLPPFPVHTCVLPAPCVPESGDRKVEGSSSHWRGGISLQPSRAEVHVWGRTISPSIYIFIPLLVKYQIQN